MNKNKDFEVFILIIILIIFVAVVYGLSKNNDDDTFYEVDRTTSISNDNYDDANMLEPDNSSSRPVKGMYGNDSIIQHRADSITHRIDSINKHILYDYHKAHNHNNTINNEDYDIVMKAYNFDELSYMMRKGYTIHQLANNIRTNLSNRNNNNHNSSSYSSGYDKGYEEGSNTAKRELENN